MRGSALVALIGILVFPWPAMAYIDPGSGSAIIAALIGFFVAVALAVKTYWYKLKALFSPKKSAESMKNTAAKEEETTPQSGGD